METQCATRLFKREHHIKQLDTAVASRLIHGENSQCYPRGSLLTAMCLAAAIQPVSAGIEAECGQEAEDQVPPSASNDMINLKADSDNAAD